MHHTFFAKEQLKETWDNATKNLKGWRIHIYHDHDNLHYTPSNPSYVAAYNIAAEMELLFAEHIQNVSEVKNVGPHAQPNIAIDISREGYAKILEWLQTRSRDQGVSILIHPETNDVLKDHLDDAMWIGKPVPFNDNFFDKIKASKKKFGP